MKRTKRQLSFGGDPLGDEGTGTTYFSRNISKTLNIPFLCFSPFSSYFRTENCSMRELRREGNAELSSVEF